MHDKQDIKEVKSTISIALKTTAGILKSNTFSERVAIAQTDETLGGGLLHVALLPDTPEPWDRYKKPIEQQNKAAK